MLDLPAYLLVFHGSADPRPQVAADQLAQLFCDRIQHSRLHPSGNSALRDASAYSSTIEPFTNQIASVHSPLVSTAYLECGPLPLHQQIQQLSQQIRSSENSDNPKEIIILPLFLLSGVHVQEDIPAEIELAQRALQEIVQITITPHLGSHPGLYRLLVERMAAFPVEAWILLAHGSRRPEANQIIESLAARLGAVAAYWAVSPSLEVRLLELQQMGIHRIGILPFFLFSGGTTDAIAQKVDQFTQQFPNLTLVLAKPFDACSELADLLVDLAQDRER